MSRESELFDRAAECNRLIELETDDVKKTALGLLRQMWIALANESSSMTERELAKEIAAIEELQSAFRSGTEKMH
jgi:hypothetical protein